MIVIKRHCLAEISPRDNDDNQDILHVDLSKEKLESTKKDI